MLCVCSLLTNTVVQTYNTGKPVWSCCWCLDNTNYVYAGLSNGSVLVYDTRDTSTYVQELQPLRSRYTHCQDHKLQLFCGDSGVYRCPVCFQVSRSVSLLRATSSVQLFPLWGSDRRLSGGGLLLGAGERDQLQTTCPAAGGRRLHRHPGGDGEQTLSGHIQTR